VIWLHIRAFLAPSRAVLSRFFILTFVSLVLSFLLAYSYGCNEVQSTPNSPLIGCYWQNRVLMTGDFLPFFTGGLGTASFSSHSNISGGDLHIQSAGPRILALPLSWVVEIVTLYVIACASIRTELLKPKILTLLSAVLIFSLIYVLSFHEPSIAILQTKEQAQQMSCSVYFLYRICSYAFLPIGPITYFERLNYELAGFVSYLIASVFSWTFYRIRHPNSFKLSLDRKDQI